jgi:hypothetical protein
MQRGDLLVEMLGQGVDLLPYWPGLVKSSIWASVWLVNEADITNEGWPVALPRFTSRPFGQQDDLLAVRELDLVDLRLDVVPLVVAQRDLDLGIEMADVADDRRSCMARMWSRVMTSTLPVAVTKMSARGAASSMVVTS